MKRETLVCVLLLVDSSIEPQQIDLDCVDWLGRKNVMKDAMTIQHMMVLIFLDEMVPYERS